MKIAIEGPPGVGKTSLCKLLASEWPSVRFIHEPVLDNPYLHDFYREPERWAFTMEAHILLQRNSYLEMTSESEDDSPTHTLMDRSPYGDWTLALAYAQLGYMTEAEWRTYEKLFLAANNEAAVPDVIVYLDAPIEILMQRVTERGRKAEGALTRPIMEEVSSMYRAVMEDLNNSDHPETRVITLDWSEFPDDGGVHKVTEAIRELITEGEQ